MGPENNVWGLYGARSEACVHDCVWVWPSHLHVLTHFSEQVSRELERIMSENFAKWMHVFVGWRYLLFGSHFYACSHIWELYALLVAVFTWSPHLCGQEIIIHTDNLAILSIWSHGSRNPFIMRLVRALFFHSASINTNILIHHIPGSTNTNADLLSRLQVHRFLITNPDADEHPTPTPHDIWTI